MNPTGLYGPYVEIWGSCGSGVFADGIPRAENDRANVVQRPLNIFRPIGPGPGGRGREDDPKKLGSESARSKPPVALEVRTAKAKERLPESVARKCG